MSLASVNKNWQRSVSTGDLDSAPVLVRISSDKKLYEFEWHTAAACVQASVVGTDCRVFDAELGTYE